MKKLYPIMLLAGATAITGAAQSKFDAAGIMVMDTYAARQLNPMAELPQLDLPGADAALSGRADDRATLFVALNEGATASDVEVRGFDIITDLGDILVVSGTMTDIQALAECDFVKAMSFGQERRPLLDKARLDTGVDKIHAGEGLTQAYTGAGVITGIMDQGLDALHANFYGKDGKTRFAKVIKYPTSSYGRATEYTADNISDFTTDTKSETHGTHTLGCMAGSYNGIGGKVTSIGGSVFKPSVKINDDLANPFYGVAIDAEIIAGCGTLLDVNTTSTAEKVRDYAKEQNKPAVLNLSLGNNIGPHDGSTLFCQALDRLGEDIIIFLSAGNEGDIDMSIDKTLSENETEFSTLFAPSSTMLSGISGFIDFWSDSSAPFELTAFIYDSSTKQILGDIISLDGTSEGRVTAPTTNQNYANAFSNGTFYMTASKNTGTNNRYNVLAYASLSFNATTNRNRNLKLGFKVKGNPGQRIMVTTNSTNATLSNNNSSEFVQGSSIFSISDMACGHNTIAVGSYNTRATWPTMGGIASYQGAAGLSANAVSGFSSYGTLVDGRTLPDICAPGCAIISSISTDYVNAGYTTENTTSAAQEYNGRMNYWEYMQGTSMSSPFCAGTVALWLEANPNLTVEDVRTILKETATKDNYVSTTGNPVQWGAGKLNAYEGLKMAIKMSAGVNDVAIEGQDKLILSSTGVNTWEVYMPHAAGIQADIYSLSGSRMASASATGDTLSISAEGLPAGIYIVNVNGSESRRIIVR